jgi:hypothetical protein
MGVECFGNTGTTIFIDNAPRDNPDSVAPWARDDADHVWELSELLAAI